MRHEALTQRVIHCFHATYNELGAGLPEQLYAAALEIVMRDESIDASREHTIRMTFRGHEIGSYRLDFLVESVLVLELKAGPVLPPGSRTQLLTYLRASGKSVGLVLFFGPTPEVQRMVL